MSDIVETLRVASQHPYNGHGLKHWLNEAAAEIERLRAALAPFANIKADNGDDFSKWPDEVIIRCEVSVREIKAARAALKVK